MSEMKPAYKFCNRAVETVHHKIDWSITQFFPPWTNFAFYVSLKGSCMKSPIEQQLPVWIDEWSNNYLSKYLTGCAI